MGRFESGMASRMPATYAGPCSGSYAPVGIMCRVAWYTRMGYSAGPMSVLALALSLALTSGKPAEPPAQGGDEVTTVQASPAADAGPGVSQRGWRQDLATGVHETTFWSRSHHRYSFTSLSLGYHMSF